MNDKTMQGRCAWCCPVACLACKKQDCPDNLITSYNVQQDEPPDESLSADAERRE